ncbi:MAG: NAD(P)-dependent oxidoreductase [Rhodospirillales bacterium]|nr:NAD(P)-dependent oxidoreductase [Rhodospirillales bacterium]MBO6788766.1 NAD(P)-dependent oxidoreductase [Rhodospirillales bacterium]
MAAPKTIGFVGLGQMGAPMATNITAKSGIEVIVYDKAGTAERAPEGAKLANSLDDVLSSADTVFLSVPDGPVSIALAGEIAAYDGRKANVVIDLSTIGPEAAREAAAILTGAGVTYIDAPVSGGQAGAAAGTITIMCGGPKAVLDDHMGVFESFTGNVVHCGETAGQGQAVKILNNYLSAVAFAASSEAITYGMSQGVEMKTILDAVNVSTGRNTATMDKFPKRILTGTYDCGFATKLQSKDMNLFVKEAKAAGTPLTVASVVASVWNGCDALKPGSDISRIYDYIREKC